MRIYLIAMVSIFLIALNGCSNESLKKYKTTATIAGSNEKLQKEHLESGESDRSHERPSHLVQCNRDLESLRTVSPSAYHRYQTEYDGLMKSSADFVTVKDDVSPEVAELARPRFQYALVSLCYRIKDALAQSLINQASGH